MTLTVAFDPVEVGSASCREIGRRGRGGGGGRSDDGRVNQGGNRGDQDETPTEPHRQIPFTRKHRPSADQAGSARRSRYAVPSDRRAGGRWRPGRAGTGSAA